ncbi:hypothetical protein TRM7615_02477 [Falsiruegeria mediterranea M17]|uniref:Uncharacterized protein n=1 Tax=Falsiruegeria mediterranea M17 TaxID=1200281 RepID=A0A2R8C952_9RHOB|nr:hypothetical protein TRM7615_02477 [Falsiruegeria mediterranea M17]
MQSQHLGQFPQVLRVWRGGISPGDKGEGEFPYTLRVVARLTSFTSHWTCVGGVV